MRYCDTTELPELKDGMIIKCIKSNVDWWTDGEEYPVRDSCITADDGDNNYKDGTGVGMTFEVLYGFELVVGRKYIYLPCNASCGVRVTYKGKTANGLCIIEFSDGDVTVVERKLLHKLPVSMNEQMAKDLNSLEYINKSMYELSDALIKLGWRK